MQSYGNSDDDAVATHYSAVARARVGRAAAAAPRGVIKDGP